MSDKKSPIVAMQNNPGRTRAAIVVSRTGPKLEVRPEQVLQGLEAAHIDAATQKEEQDVRKLAEDRQTAADTGCCPATVRLRRRAIADCIEERVCGRVTVRMGYCRQHYNSEVLRVRSSQAGGKLTRRPFADWQLPGNMTERDHEVLAALPVETPYEACLAAMNKAGRKNGRLKPVTERPAKAQRMRRQNAKKS